MGLSMDHCEIRQRIDRTGEIRVFVSSTFLDMNEERDLLNRHVFPKIARQCRQRGVTFTVVDLRWGITEDQANNNQVVPVCLREIDRCRPYFIAMLGERYGWTDYQLSPELTEAFPWLRSDPAANRASLTHLEILHGVLNNPGMAGWARFYLRDPAYAGKTEKFISRGEADRKRLRELKATIRSSGFPVRDYPDPAAFAAIVETDLNEILEAAVPADDSVLDPLDRQAVEHERYALSRLERNIWRHDGALESRGVYLGRREYSESLDAHANGHSESPLIVTGESGAGKTALLSNWVYHTRINGESSPIILHFVGGTAEAADWSLMVRRIMGEFQRLFQVQGEIPDNPEKLKQVFPNWLNMAGSAGRCILVIDALDQLEDRDRARDLAWLPPVIPANIRLILSTLPGRSLEEIDRRGWINRLEVKPLDNKEREQLIVAFLGQRRKKLTDHQIRRLAGAENSSNPLYLKALLEELCVCGRHETLNRQMDDYLAATDVPALFDLIFSRWESDYQACRPDLVKDILSLILVSRRGLGEKDLSVLLGDDSGPLPFARFAAFRGAADTALVNRSGLMTFSHSHIRQAVECRYLSDTETKKSIHLRLADYFSDQEPAFGDEGDPSFSLRTLDELPWQLHQAKAWQRLYDLLRRFAFFRQAWKVDDQEVQLVWAALKRNGFRVADAYRKVLSNPDRYAGQAWALSYLLNTLGEWEESLFLKKCQVDYYQKHGGEKDYASALNSLATSLIPRGRLPEAMENLKKAERICRERDIPHTLANCLGNQALILADWGRLDQAMGLHEEESQIYRRLNDQNRLATCLNNQAVIVSDRGEFDTAMKLYGDTERIFRNRGDRNGLCHALNNMASILVARGDLQPAMEMFQEVGRISRELGNVRDQMVALGNQAVVLTNQGQFDAGMRHYKDQERLCRELEDKDGLRACLGNQAVNLYKCNRIDAALVLHKEEERLCRELDSPRGLANCLANQANCLKEGGQSDSAMEKYQVAEKIYRDMHNPMSLHKCLHNRADILRSSGQLEEAMDLYREQARICRKLKDHNSLQDCLFTQTGILCEQKRLDEALAVCREHEQLCRSLGNPGAVKKSLKRQAGIEKAMDARPSSAFLRALEQYTELEKKKTAPPE